MEPVVPKSTSDSFEDHPRYINYAYNQLDHALDEKVPQQKSNPEKNFMIIMFFFFAVGIVISLIVLVGNVTRQQQANSVSASVENVTNTQTPNY